MTDLKSKKYVDPLTQHCEKYILPFVVVFQYKCFVRTVKYFYWEAKWLLRFLFIIKELHLMPKTRKISKISFYLNETLITKIKTRLFIFFIKNKHNFWHLTMFKTY